MGAGVASVAAALPREAVGNAGIAERIGVDPEWIVERTGVRSRRVAGQGERLTELAAEAGTRALAAASVEPAEVELVLVATMSHDYLTPGAAPLVARAMGCRAAGAMDVGAACTGFVSALGLASGLIESGRCAAAVVIGADVLSRLTDPDDRSTAALFGDGAGAVVMRAAAGPSRVGPTVFGSDGERAELIEAGRAEGRIRMKGPDTYRQAVDRLSESAAEAARLAGVGLDEIDLFAFHQANGRILTAVAERLDLDRGRVIDVISHLGNTSAASIPLALAQADGEGRLRPGSRVLLAAFGGGLTWGATVLDWGTADAT
jgi:3-oxoacyl-[acyl-carrier-protein] synthase-3